MDRLEAMRVLVTIVDGGSLSAASRRLSMPLATVSRKVSDLEAALGSQLLVRSPRRLALTDAGTAYLDACRRILEEVEAAERLASGEYVEPKGELVVTAPIVFGRMHVLPAVTAFLSAYPNINVQLLLGDRWMNLVEQHVDVALRIGTLPDSTLVARRIGDTRIVSCASPDYLDARGRPQKPEDLVSHDCVLFDGLPSGQQWGFVQGKHRVEVPVRSRLTVTTAEAAIDAAVAGLGITRVVAYQVASLLQQRTLEKVLVPFEPPSFPINLVFPAHGRLPLKVRVFIDFVLPLLQMAIGQGQGSSGIGQE